MRQLLESSTQPGVKAVLQNLDLVTTELQENIMNTRMQPIRVLFDRMPRLVRDMAHRLGKKVELETSGGDVELDRSIIESLADPMTHMLRNALDHGLEDPEGPHGARQSATTGRVSVRAYHERGRVVIEVQDDGRGIDPERVKESAVARGAITREQGAALSEKDAIQLDLPAGALDRERDLGLLRPRRRHGRGAHEHPEPGRADRRGDGDRRGHDAASSTCRSRSRSSRR